MCLVGDVSGRGGGGGGGRGGGQTPVVDKFSFNRISSYSALYSPTIFLSQGGEAIEREHAHVCVRVCVCVCVCVGGCERAREKEI